MSWNTQIWLHLQRFRTNFSENRTDLREAGATGAALTSKEVSRLTSAPAAVTSSGFNSESRILRLATEGSATVPPFFCATPEAVLVVVFVVVLDVSFREEAPKGFVSTDIFRESVAVKM